MNYECPRRNEKKKQGSSFSRKNITRLPLILLSIYSHAFKFHRVTNRNSPNR